jgi:hypothetical protein
MRKIWRRIVDTIFWSYERGSWPYDLMVIAILVFVLFTPRGWFHDQPQSNPLEQPGIQLLTGQPDGKLRTYRIDAKLLPPQKRALRPTPELERETHDILSRNVEDLKGHTFQVVEINPVRADDGTVSSYEVSIRL